MGFLGPKFQIRLEDYKVCIIAPKPERKKSSKGIISPFQAKPTEKVVRRSACPVGFDHFFLAAGKANI